VRLPTVASRG